MLADARHDGPVPPEVAARLDEVLAGLHADADSAADADSLRRRDRAPTPSPPPSRSVPRPSYPCAGGPRGCRATCSPRPRCS